MVFSSMTFLILFLPAVICLYFLFPSAKWRNGVLVAFSLLFYAWGEPVRILLMLASIFINYSCAVFIDHFKSPGLRRLFLILGLSVTIGLLGYFKYFAFFANAIAGLLGAGQVVTPQELPIGISFFSFQIITYTVDVYLKKVPVQRSVARLVLYISFFPQLIAGPIVNYTYIQPQLAKRKTSADGAFRGLCRFCTGLAKKVLLANVCGEILSELPLTGELSLLGAWLGIVAYALQIYFDFSGYSDMAIGLGQIFGFRFLENFNYPYLSTSITEFWRRWHISLGAFFREYVYIPMGGNRVKPARHILNLLVVWGLTGLWHGASWNFILWGLYYGLLLVLEKYLLSSLLEKLPKVLRWAVTMLLVLVGWVFFYHESLSDGMVHLGAMFGIGIQSLADLTSIYYFKRYLGVLIAACLACLPWKHLFSRLLSRQRPDGKLRPGPWYQRLQSAAALALLLISVTFLISSSYNPFLYFRF